MSDNSASTRRVLETPLMGDFQGKALYLATHVTSAKNDNACRSSRLRSKAPSAAHDKRSPQPFDPEADFTFESTAASPESYSESRAEALQASYCRLCRTLQITPCSAFLKQLGNPNLSLNQLKLHREEFKAVLTTLLNDTDLLNVDLTGNPAGWREATYIGELLRANKFITHLVLSEMNLTGLAMSHLSKTIKSCIGLMRVDLSSNFLCDKDGDSICTILEETDGIRELILHHNQLGDCGVLLGRAIADNMTVTSLDLSWNHIRGQGAIGIARGLQRNQHITKLNVSWNGFGFDGCSAMAHTLFHNTTLQVLDLTSNRIHLPALHKLMDGVAKNKTLTTLLIGLNPIPAHCTTYILHRLLKWKHGNLKELDLHGVVVDESFEKTLREIQADRLFMVRFDTAIPFKKSVTSKLDPKNIFNIDPVRIMFFMKEHMRTIDLFLKVDKDFTGTLSKEEMKYAFELDGYPISDMALDQVMGYLDTNHRHGDVDLQDYFAGEKLGTREMVRDDEDMSRQADGSASDRKAKVSHLTQAFKKQRGNQTPGMSPRSNTFL